MENFQRGRGAPMRHFIWESEMMMIMMLVQENGRMVVVVEVGGEGQTFHFTHRFAATHLLHLIDLPGGR